MGLIRASFLVLRSSFFPPPLAPDLTRATARQAFFVLGSSFFVLSSAFLVPSAQAQTAGGTFTGFATGFIGLASGGGVADPGWTPGGSIAILDPSGFGAELDLSRVREFNKARFVESSMTSLMINAIAVWNDGDARLRPFVAGGVGLLRARACLADCQSAVTRTDWGFDAGGGVFLLFNEVVGARGDVRYFRSLQRSDLPPSGNGYFDFWRTSIGVTVSWPIR